MERIEDRSKALSYIGIEIADALKLIPTPQDDSNEVEAILNEIKEETPEEKDILWTNKSRSKTIFMAKN